MLAVSSLERCMASFIGAHNLVASGKNAGGRPTNGRGEHWMGGGRSAPMGVSSTQSATLVWHWEHQENLGLILIRTHTHIL